ncbi:hypothetical protein [Spirosoma agri]|nr:hypothetical protein [Spirosoma agri]
MEAKKEFLPATQGYGYYKAELAQSYRIMRFFLWSSVNYLCAYS